MNKKIHSVMMLTLLLIGMLTLAFNIQTAKATETIYIRPDGSIDPPTAPIERDGDLYTLTGNITSGANGIVVERNNMTLDGAGYTLQGTGHGEGIGLDGRSNVTIKNTKISAFYYGIRLYESSNNNISGNNITENNYTGIWLDSSSNNTVSGNTITNNNYHGVYLSGSFNTVSDNTITNNNCYGVWLDESSDINVSGNTITNNNYGVRLYYCSDNTISGNTITNNEDGVYLYDCSDSTVSGNTITNNDYYGVWLRRASNNRIYRNNFINNTQQVYDYSWDHPTYPISINIWDDGYPSGGNYWSDNTGVDLYSGPYQNETGSDGIGDTPYVIDANNRDNYPLMEPWIPAPPIPTTMDELKTEIEELHAEGEIDNQGIVTSLLAKLDVAQKLVDKGKIEEAKSILEEDFIPQVQNLSGIHITPEAANTLIESAEYILSHL